MGTHLQSSHLVSQEPLNIQIPNNLLPADGRFASGPSKVRPEAIADFAAMANGYMGTSHRKPGVKDIVGRLRSGMTELFGLPDGWEVVMGNGGTTLFWDAATFGLIKQQSQHLSFGEFSGKFASAVSKVPFLNDPQVITSDYGSHPVCEAEASVDTYCLTHNETTTGVTMPLVRPAGAAEGALVAVDATSAAGAVAWDPSQVDCYYFAPQKVLASDGGLWFALCSPAALERIERIAASDRWIPAGLSLQTAVNNSVKNQTYNTPALATIYLTLHQVEWINNNGGMDFAAGRSKAMSDHVYAWAEASSVATPFVTDTAMRSQVVATVDFDDSVKADDIAAALRANGILDTEGYRKLGRNQLRIACFPAIELSDMQALTACIDNVVSQLSA